MSLSNALRGVKAAEEICRVAVDRLDDVIGYKNVHRKDTTREVRLRTRARQRKAFFTQLRHELEAAGAVVKQPSQDEIKRVQALIAKVKTISVQEAAGRAGMQLGRDVKAALDSLNASMRGVRAA